MFILSDTDISSAVILTSFSILVVTLTRLIFIKYPLTWRSLLTYRAQGGVILGAVLSALLLGCAPLYGLCDLYGTRRGCFFVNDGTPKSVGCLAVTLGLGIGIPNLTVVLTYILIYKLVCQARESHRALATPGLERGAERDKVPWSILTILACNLVSLAPWLFLAPNTRYLFRAAWSVLLMDLAYSSMYLATALGPLAYLVMTRSVRVRAWDTLKSCCMACRKPSS